MRAVNEHQLTSGFLNHLAVIEEKILASVKEMAIDVDLFSEFGDINNESVRPDIKIIWCLHRMTTLFKEIKKGAVTSRNIWFIRAGFYARLHHSIPELEDCLILLNTFEFGQPESITEDNRFILGALFLEIIHTLNDAEGKELWENLCHGSGIWRQAMNVVPSYLYSSLLSYYRRQDVTKQATLLQSVKSLKLHAYITSLSSLPVTTRTSLNTIKELIQLIPNESSSTNVSNTPDVEQRLKILLCLKGHLVSPNHSISAAWLSKLLLEFPWDQVNNAFDSCISQPNTYSYLKPEDKLRHVFDAIVLDPEEKPQSELWSLMLDIGTAISPIAPKDISPGKAFIQDHKSDGEYYPNDLNENLYNNLTGSLAKKTQYVRDAQILVNEMIERLTEEKKCMTLISQLEAGITTYQALKRPLLLRITDVSGLLDQQLTHLETYAFSESAVKQFRHFTPVFHEAERLLCLKQHRLALHELLMPLRNIELPKNSFLYQKIVKIEQDLEKISSEGVVLEDLNVQFALAIDCVTQYEKMYKEAQAQFLLPHFCSKPSRLPYLSILALFMASLTVAISVGVLTGNPNFSFFVWPVLAKYMTPLCIALAGAGTLVAMKSLVDLSQYSFFAAQIPSDHAASTFEPIALL